MNIIPPTYAVQHEYNKGLCRAYKHLDILPAHNTSSLANNKKNNNNNSLATITTIVHQQQQ